MSRGLSLSSSLWWAQPLPSLEQSLPAFYSRTGHGFVWSTLVNSCLEVEKFYPKEKDKFYFFKVQRQGNMGHVNHWWSREVHAFFFFLLPRWKDIDKNSKVETHWWIGLHVATWRWLHFGLWLVLVLTPQTHVTLFDSIMVSYTILPTSYSAFELSFFVSR